MIEEQEAQRRRKEQEQQSFAGTLDIAERELSPTDVVVTPPPPSSVNAATQTDFKHATSSLPRPNASIRKSKSASDSSHVTAMVKEDAHLMSTIRGMRVDLAIKEKAMQRLTRELDDCKKTARKLQKEKDGNILYA